MVRRHPAAVCVCRTCRFPLLLSSAVSVTCGVGGLSRRFVGGFVSPFCRIPRGRELAGVEFVGCGAAALGGERVVGDATSRAASGSRSAHPAVVVFGATGQPACLSEAPELV